MINRSVVESIIRNKIILGGISKGGHYYNQHVFFPRNEDGYRNYKYYQPSSCMSRGWPGKDPKFVDIRKNREGSQSGSLMNRGRSEQVTLMWERLKGIDCIRELVILFSDADLKLYRKYLKEEGYTEQRLMDLDLRRHWYLNYVSADFYFPEYHMIFELDSSYHIPGIDKARDKVLKESYGLDTIRFFRYDLSQDFYNPRITESLGIANKKVPLYFNQLELLVDRFIESNPGLVEELDKRISLGMKEPLKSLLV